MGENFGTRNQRPIVEALADDFRAEPVSGGLQLCYVIHGQEGIVVFAEAHLGAFQLTLDEGMSVEIVGGLEGEERTQAHHERPQDLIADVEVVSECAGCAGAPGCGSEYPWWDIWDC